MTLTSNIITNKRKTGVISNYQMPVNEILNRTFRISLRIVSEKKMFNFSG